MQAGIIFLILGRLAIPLCIAKKAVLEYIQLLYTWLFATLIHILKRRPRKSTQEPQPGQQPPRNFSCLRGVGLLAAYRGAGPVQA